MKQRINTFLLGGILALALFGAAVRGRLRMALLPIRAATT